MSNKDYPGLNEYSDYGYVIALDGDVKAVVETPDDAFMWLMDNQSCSASMALCYQGWTCTPITLDTVRAMLENVGCYNLIQVHVTIGTKQYKGFWYSQDSQYADGETYTVRALYILGSPRPSWLKNNIVFKARTDKRRRYYITSYSTPVSVASHPKFHQAGAHFQLRKLANHIDLGREIKYTGITFVAEV